METVYSKPEVLSPQERRLLADFRATDARGRHETLLHVSLQVRMAIEFAPRPRHHLRLVKGGESS